MATEGNPGWLLRLEQAQMQLHGENYVRWLQTQAKEIGIPDEVIQAQLLREGVVTDVKVQQEAETVAEPIAKPAQRGTKVNKK